MTRISILGHRAPTVGFEVPLEMLSARHLRIEAQLDTWRRLVPYLASRGSDDEARAAASSVMRYFDTSAMQEIVAGRASALDNADVEALAGIYTRHIEREEEELLPMAAWLLDDGELDRIGRAVAGEGSGRGASGDASDGFTVPARSLSTTSRSSAAMLQGRQA